VTTVPGEALPPRMAPAVAVMTGGPPPSNNLAQVLVQWVNGVCSSGIGG
jgi:hypothetical protein